MVDINELLTNQDALRGHLERIQASAADKRIEGVSSCGRVRVVVDGTGHACELLLDGQSIKLGPAVLEAVNDALAKSKLAMQAEVEGVIPPGLLEGLGG